MPIKDYTSPHLGEYIRLLQRLVPVNGHLLTNREVALMAGLSESTYKRVKKGRASAVCLLRRASSLPGSLSLQYAFSP